MKINYQKRFLKQYSKLNEKTQKKVDGTIKKFIENPFDKTLYNHPLKGLLKNRRSISATGDLRIHFEEYENYTLILMLDIGTHSQLY